MQGYDPRLLDPNRKTIFLDLDGCVSDFTGHLQKHLRLEDMTPEEFLAWVMSKRGIVDTLPYEFWVDMPFLPNGRKLYDFCKEMTATVICTSPGNSPCSSSGKHAFLNKNFKGSRNWIITGAKWAFANDRSLLIDDRPKNVDRFNQAGGKAFLYHDSKFDEVQQWILNNL